MTSKVHPVYNDGERGFVISDGGGWRPGAFADEATARKALELTDEVLQRLQDAAIARGGDRTITAADIEQWKPWEMTDVELAAWDAAQAAMPYQERSGFFKIPPMHHGDSWVAGNIRQPHLLGVGSQHNHWGIGVTLEEAIESALRAEIEGAPMRRKS